MQARGRVKRMEREGTYGERGDGHSKTVDDGGEEPVHVDEIEKRKRKMTGSSVQKAVGEPQFAKERYLMSTLATMSKIGAPAIHHARRPKRKTDLLNRRSQEEHGRGCERRRQERRRQERTLSLTRRDGD